MPVTWSNGGAIESVHNSAMFTVDSAGVPTPISATSPLPTSSGATTAANVLTGYQTFAVTTVATTVLTVPAGRTWVGQVGAACACAVVAGSATVGQARAVFTTAGAGVTPAAGAILAAEAKAGANAATGTTGSNGSRAVQAPFTIVAPVGNAVTVQVTTTQSGTSSVVDAWCTGALV